MNILYYLHQFPAIGGIEAVTATLANYYAAQGHAVTIVSHIDKGQLGSGMALDARVDVLHTPDTQHVTKGNRAFLQKAIRERDIDIVVFQDSYAAIEPNLLPFDGKAKVITVEHSAPYFVSEFMARYSLFRKILWHLRHPFWERRRAAYGRNRRRFLYSHSDRYVLLSNQFYGEFRAITGLKDTRKLRAIPNPFAAQLKAARCAKQNEIVFCATLSDLKGCDLLLHVWQEIQARCPGWRLTVVGDGPDRALLERLKEVLKLERCTFEGYHADPSGYFARAKIFAFPSRREGWGLVLVEAMSNGCVPVAFDSYGAVHDIVSDGANGFVVPAFDLDMFGSRIVQLATDNCLLGKMSEEARNADGEFLVSRIAGIWEETFRALMRHENEGGNAK